MSRKQGFGLWLVLLALCVVAPGNCQITPEPVGQPQGGEHHHGGMHMNIPDTAGQKCEPKFTYAEGPTGPDHWPGQCSNDRMQSPIDITRSEKLPIPLPDFRYEPAELRIFNNCNKYTVQLLFPDNNWLRVARKPYFLTELHFHEPGEHAVNGKRARMVIHLVHLSPESTFLIVEVPVVAGKENPVIKTLWEHIPPKGQEQKIAGVQINPMDLLPANHKSFYRLSGSLTNPICNDGVWWYVMKDPIEMSEAQIRQYMKHYHDTARPLQPAGDRTISEPSQ